MDILTQIVNQKLERLAQARANISLEQIRKLAHDTRRAAKSNTFIDALQTDRLNIIAEFKRRSPSKGVIRAGANLPQILRSYQAGGAAAVSVLTEEDHFSGSLDDLRQAKATIDLPVLRKDFIFDEYQVYESAAAGAAALLLIVAALDDKLLARLRQLTEVELGMDALVEVHNGEEMKRAAAAKAKLIGVNNRNLRTFEVSLETSLALASAAPPGVTMISESGLNTTADLQVLHEAGYRGFLIGETVMCSENPEQMIRELRAVV
jgi:indole-3-glycerol phosphate synthase